MPRKFAWLTAFYLFFICFSPIITKAYPGGPPVFSIQKIKDLKVLSVDGRDLKKEYDHKLSCFLFLSPECPLSINYTSVIQGLQEKFRNDVTFYIIIPGKDFPGKVIQNFRTKYLHNCTITRDMNFTVSSYLKATVTPEVVLISNKTGEQVYRGAIDNWAVSLGKQRSNISEHYLSDAIDGFITNNAIALSTKPVGCFINN